MACDPSIRPVLRRDAERNRERVLEAAASVFARVGVTASMDQIASEAGVGVGTVYRRFPDKQSLIEALFEDRMLGMLALAEHALAAEDPWEGLVGFLRKAAAQQSTDVGLRQVLLSSFQGGSVLTTIRGRLEPVIEELVRRAQAQGSLRADVAATDVPLLLFMTVDLEHSAGTAQLGLHRRYLELVIDGLRAENARGDLGPPVDHDRLEEILFRLAPVVK